MKFGHAAALALVLFVFGSRHAFAGWYLMSPPNQEMLDPACQWRHSTILGDLKALACGGDANIVQCDLESLSLDESAPLSAFEQPVLEGMEGPQTRPPTAGATARAL